MDKLTMAEVVDMIYNNREMLLVMTIINDMPNIEPIQPDPKAWCSADLTSA